MKKIILFFLLLVIFGCKKENIVNPVNDYPPQVGEYDLISPYGIDIFDFSISSKNPSEILIACGDTVLVTTDYGKNWKISILPEVAKIFDVEIGSDDYYYLLSDRSIYFSRDKGNNWIKMEDSSYILRFGLAGYMPHRINADFADRGILLFSNTIIDPYGAHFSPAFFYFSSNKGLSWEFSNYDFDFYYSYEISTGGYGNNIVIFSMNLPNTLARSTNFGIHFEKVSSFDGRLVEHSLSKSSDFGVGLITTREIKKPEILGREKLALTNDAFSSLSLVSNYDFENVLFNKVLVGKGDLAFVSLKKKFSDSSFVYISKDKGQSWQRLGIDADLKTKLGYDALNKLLYVVKPNKGLYRFKL